MNTIDSAQPSHQDDFPLPEFLGCPPDEGPERLPEEPWLSLCYLTGRILEAHPGKEPGPSHDQLREFIQAFFDLPYDAWNAAQTRFFAEEQLLIVSPKLAWLNYFRCLKRFEAPAQEKIKTTEAPKKHKDIPRSLQLLLLKEHILKEAPSKNCELIYSTVFKEQDRKRSARGKIIYSAGQRHACKTAGLPTRKTKDGRTAPGRSFDREWAWLVKHGILNKAWNENPEAKQCAGWYVCTSLKAVVWARDPQNRHRKTSP